MATVATASDSPRIQERVPVSRNVSVAGVPKEEQKSTIIEQESKKQTEHQKEAADERLEEAKGVKGVDTVAS